MNPTDKPYDYTAIGFDAFLTRSIDSLGVNSLDASAVAGTTQELNYDQSQTSGSLGSVLQIGNIQLDGANGRITIFDEDGNEVVWIGNIDG